MLPPVNGSTEKYLGDLDRIQSLMETLQRQVSSGVRVSRASDDPAAVPLILATQSRIAENTQLETNLNQVKTELDTGDSVLQQAIKSIEQAVSLGTQASTTLSDSQHATLLEQVRGIQAQLVGITRTTVAGRYIFSGDLDQQPLYALDPTQPEGVRQLATPTSTRVNTDANGATLWTAPTAQRIFDPRNPDQSPAPGNVFAAVNSLLTAIETDNDSAANTAVDALKVADDHLNQQLGLYGIAQTRVADALDSAARSITNQKQDLSSLRDADVAADAVQMSQVTLQQQAALSARAKTSQLSLFEYLA